MTSYTNNISLIVPTPADPAVANIWGGLLNTDWALIDQAIAGQLTKSVAGSANVILTNTQGASNESRNNSFIFSGAITGNVDVLFPASVTKTFIASNATSGAFTLSLGVNNGSGAPAGAVAVLAPGAVGLFQSDGTNVVVVGITASGTTGTGAVVLQTSPTIVSPTVSGTAIMPDGSVFNSGGFTVAQVITIDADATSFINNNATLSNYNGNNFVYLTGNGSGGLSLNGDGTNRAQSINIPAGTSGSIHVGVGGPHDFYFADDGSFLVGTASVAGAGAIAATGNITAFFSDDRLKTRTGPIENAIEKIMSLSAFYYHANDLAVEIGKGVYDASVQEVGLSAQEVQKILPEVIAPAPIDHEYLTIRYERFVALLVAGTQQQQRQIEAQQAQIDALLKRLEK